MNNKKIYLMAADPKLLARWQQQLPDAEVCTDLQLLTMTTDAILLVETPAESMKVAELAIWRFADRIKIVAMAGLPSDELGLAVLDRGAVGFVHAYCEQEVLAQVIAVVASGEIWVGKSLLQRLLKGVSRLPAATPATTFSPDLLTERELEVAKLIAKGESNKEIARVLEITERTVKAHVSMILEKLNVQDRLQLALKVNGIL